jgi:hypothetical protein
MAFFNTYPMRNSAVLRINFEKDTIDTNPEYQRNSDVWTLEKRQLLIDSILNDYDIPKLYFHALQKPKRNPDGKELKYAIIDGRQRIETIWSFINGDFALSTDFQYLADNKVKAGGLTYPDLAKAYPKLKNIFDSFTIPIICVETDDIDLIEDMFSRLNEAVPLNAAEKRNAIGGSMASMIRQIAKHDFFKQDVKFSNKRYQHREVAVKLLYIEKIYSKNNKIPDTLKPYLDAFVKEYKDDPLLNASEVGVEVKNILNEMHTIFVNKDALLRAQSTVPIYFLVIRQVIKDDKLNTITRDKFINFDSNVQENRAIAEEDITKANYDLLNYDRMSQQGANYGASIRERFRIMREFIGI